MALRRPVSRRHCAAGGRPRGAVEEKKVIEDKKKGEKGGSSSPTPVPQYGPSLLQQIGGRISVITTTDQAPVEALWKKLAKSAVAHKESGKDFYLTKSDRPLALFRAGERTVVIGLEKDVRRALKTGPAKGPPAMLLPAAKLLQE